MLPWALSLSGGYKNPAGGCRTCHLPGHQCLIPGKCQSLGQLPSAHGWGLGASSCGNMWRSIQNPGLDLSSAPGAVAGVGGLGDQGLRWLWQWQGVDAQCGHTATSAVVPAQHCPASTRALAQGAASGRRSFPGHGQGCLPGPGARWARCPLLHTALVAAPAGRGEPQSSSSAPARSSPLVVVPHAAGEGMCVRS